MYVVICKIDHFIHIHWCIVMRLGHNDPWVESHMWLQQTWGQRSCRGQWPLVQVFGKKDQCIHILWCIFKSNITMIAKVCARESRRDSWFENPLVASMLLQLQGLRTKWSLPEIVSRIKILKKGPQITPHLVGGGHVQSAYQSVLALKVTKNLREIHNFLLLFYTLD